MPRKETQSLRRGDIVKYSLDCPDLTGSTYAVVVEVNGEAIRLRNYEYGFPFCIDRKITDPDLGKATVNDAADHILKIAERHGASIEQGGLFGAIAARKKQYLAGVSNYFKTMNETLYPIVPDPNTGVYVLMGVYSGQGGSEHLQGLIVTPRLSEDIVSSLVKELHPKGFGDIPGEVNNTRSTSHGDLVNYWTFEVPEIARNFVNNPRHIIVAG